jgi:mRNA degradation ribonuclease J1/J2
MPEKPRDNSAKVPKENTSRSARNNKLRLKMGQGNLLLLTEATQAYEQDRSNNEQGYGVP